MRSPAAFGLPGDVGTGNKKPKIVCRSPLHPASSLILRCYSPITLLFPEQEIASLYSFPPIFLAFPKGGGYVHHVRYQQN